MTLKRNNFRTPYFTALFRAIKQQLSAKEITIYEAVDEVVPYKEQLFSQFKKEILTNKKPYFRLFAAWCLGKAQLPKSKTILESAYFRENDNNTRANIVWAYLGLENHRQQMYSHFLRDPYFLIRLIALKNIRAKNEATAKLPIRMFLNKREHPLVRIEAIRKAYLFRDNKHYLLKIIGDFLLNSNDLTETAAGLRSIGKLRNNLSLRTLVEFYQKRGKLLMNHQALALEFCYAISELNESAAYDTLRRLYLKNPEKIVKYGIIEALAVGGGPGSLEALKLIYKKETNARIKQFIETLIENTELTVV